MKRFNVLGDFGQEAEDGEWVRYEDHAAERAALVAQLAELTRERDEARVRLSVSRGCRKAAKAKVTRLTEDLAAADAHAADTAAAYAAKSEALILAEARVRELEAALAAAELNFEAADNRYQDAAAHNRDLTQALAAKEQGGSRWCTVCQQRAEKAEAEVTRLTRERDEALARGDSWKATCAINTRHMRTAESEVTRLTEDLAAAERGHDHAIGKLREAFDRAEAAEARVRELTQALEAAERKDEERVEQVMDEMRLREAAEARVEALEVLLAASEARAAQWQEAARGYQGDATVAQDRLAALKAKAQRAVQRLTYDEELLAETRIERALEALHG